MLVLNSQRTSRSIDGRTSRTRELRHAAAAIAAELRSVRSRDLHAWNDTLVEFDATVGIGFICATPSANVVDLLPSSGNDALRSTWNSAVDIGDRIHLAATPPNPTETPELHDAAITDIGTSSTACSASSLRPLVPGTITRITITPAPTAPPLLGTTARVVRRTRISLYKTSDNEWFVGMRSLHTSGWETTQPVAGPFASAAQRGLRFTLVSRGGATLAAHTTAMPVDTSAANSPISINLVMRATSKWQTKSGAREADSLITTISLRNR
jgi:hypothetical protein